MIDLKSYHTIWTDVWRLFKKYAEMLPLDEDGWENLVSEMDAICADHKDHEQLAVRMLVEASNEIERMQKGMV